MQSVSLPGRAGPREVFLRSTTLAVLSLSLAASIMALAITFAVLTFEFNHRENLSETIPCTIEAI